MSNYLFFTGYDGFAYSISAEDGKVLWKKFIKYPSMQNLFYENGRVYILTNNSEVLALEAASGEDVWTYTKKNQRKISVGALGNFVSIGPLLITGLSSGEVVALEKTNGKVRWIRRLNFNARFRDIKTITLFDTDKLLVAGYDDHIYSLDVVSGALKWKRKFSVVTNFVNVEKGEVCFGSSENQIKCLNPSIGAETKSIKINSISGEITKIDDQTIVYGLSAGGVQILNLNTMNKINYVTSSGVSNAPSWNIKDQEVYFNSNFGNLYVLKLKQDIKGSM